MYSRGFAYEQSYEQYGPPYPVTQRVAPPPAQRYEPFIYGPPAHCRGFSRFPPGRNAPPSFNHIPAYPSYPNTQSRMGLADIPPISEARARFCGPTLTQASSAGEKAPSLHERLEDVARYHYQESGEKLAENCASSGKRLLDEQEMLGTYAKTGCKLNH